MRIGSEIILDHYKIKKKNANYYLLILCHELT